jgi:hypothetical protein
VKKLPADWINEDGVSMNFQFLRYAQPLVQDEVLRKRPACFRPTQQSSRRQAACALRFRVIVFQRFKQKAGRNSRPAFLLPK